MTIRSGLASLQGYLLRVGNRCDYIDENERVFRIEYNISDSFRAPKYDLLLEEVGEYIQRERAKIQKLRD